MSPPDRPTRRNMPYIVTTLVPVYSEHGAATSPTGRAYDLEPESEVAVGTLGEAREWVAKRFDHRTAIIAVGRDIDQAIAPDGTLIEVREVGWGVFREHLTDSELLSQPLTDEREAEILAAFNNKE